MNTASGHAERVSELQATGAAVTDASPERTEGSRSRRLLAAAVARYRLAVAVYLGTRVLLLLVAVLDRQLRHHALTHELANWDGLWFRRLANRGYPAHALRTKTTLGFFPLYPMVMWAVAHTILASGSILAITVAGLFVSGVGGLVATVLAQELATGWWGPEAGRRAAVIFCLFPGSVVFSMVYSEGLLLPLAMGCILALERRRWVLAGALAGVATAVEPTALAVIPVCAVASVIELRRRGFRDPAARASLLAPALSLAGVGAFAAFLWAWTGTPLASFTAQHHGWGEKTDFLALVHQAQALAAEISLRHFNHPTINLNLVAGLLGAAFLLVGLVLLLRRPRSVSLEAIVWSLGVGFFAVTSEYTPPNPRLLLTAFPVVLVFAYWLGRIAWRWFLVVNGALLAGMSYLTFVSVTLRP